MTRSMSGSEDRLKKKLLKFSLMGLAVVLIATLVVTLMPARVNITQDGILSVGTNVALAVSNPPEGESTEQSYTVEEEPVESVWMRTKNSKVFHSYGIPNKDYHDIYLDAIHYEVGYSREIETLTENETIYWTVWEDIDNTLESTIAPWDWQMVKADYNVYFLEDFTYGQILKFEKADPHGTVLGNVAFQPMALQWTNDLDQVQEVSMPQSGILSVTGNKIQWEDAYGSNIDFQWSCHSTRLIKLLTIDSLNDLSTPEQYILDGGNPVLRLDFIFDPVKDLDIYVDGILWDKKSDVPTFGTIEFKLGDEILWGFMPLWVWDSSGGNEFSVVQKLERVGGKLFVSIRVPYEWIENATFPIYIDTIIDESVETSSDDAHELVSDGSMDLTDTIIDLGFYTGGATHTGYIFTEIDTTDVENVHLAYLELYPAESDSGAVSYTWYGENTANATTFTTDTFDISNRARTTASVIESSPVGWTSGIWVQTSDLSEILNEVFSGDNWTSGSNLAILNIYDSGKGERRARSWDYDDHSKAPKLHFENVTEVTYYFDSISTTVWTDYGYWVDNVLTNYASTAADGNTDTLDANTCPGTDLGTITKVELRVYGYGDGNDRIDLWVYPAPATEFQLTMPGSPGWSTYVDITSKRGSWSWANIQGQDVDCEFDKVQSGGTMRGAKVEIRVTYWIPPVADIDVGAASVDRASNTGPGWTFIAKDNPANDSGTLQNVKVYAMLSLEGLMVGTFYSIGGDDYKCRDSVLIGDVEQGAERTFTGLSIAVEAGDYIGFFCTVGLLEVDTTGGAGAWIVSGEHIDPNDEATYTSYPGYVGSLYGYGDLVEGPEISNTPPSKGFGILEINTTSSTTINYFQITNTGTGAVDVVIYAIDFTGGDDTWDLSDTATPGENIYGLKAGLDDDDDLFDVVVRETEAYNELVNNLIEDATQDWGLKLYMPTTVPDYDGQQMTATVTLVCSAN